MSAMCMRGKVNGRESQGREEEESLAYFVAAVTLRALYP
jgi:hypothetical protein